MRYVALQFLTLGLLIASAVTDGHRAPWEGAVASWAGIACGVGGAILVVWARKSLGASFRVVPEPGERATLVTVGIYSRLRHPMYVAVGLGALGVALLRGTLETAAAALAVVLVLRWKTRHEEACLRARFPEYDAYARGSGLRRWFRRSPRTE